MNKIWDLKNRTSSICIICKQNNIYFMFVFIAIVVHSNEICYNYNFFCYFNNKIY